MTIYEAGQVFALAVPRALVVVPFFRQGTHRRECACGCRGNQYTGRRIHHTNTPAVVRGWPTAVAEPTGSNDSRPAAAVPRVPVTHAARFQFRPLPLLRTAAMMALPCSRYVALAEHAFGSLVQRFMFRPHHVRLHYGHPDMVNAHLVRKTGGLSRGARDVNFNTDIFLGYEMMVQVWPSSPPRRPSSASANHLQP